MSEADVVRAWKSRQYRANLSRSQRDRLPANPAGAVELPDDELLGVAAGAGVRPEDVVDTALDCTLMCTYSCTETFECYM